MLTLTAAEMLSSSVDARKQSTEKLFTDMADGKIGAFTAFAGIVDHVIYDMSDGTRHFPHDTLIASYNRSQNFPRYGVFVTKAATSFITEFGRSRGYVSAIARQPQARVIVDAGCGAGAFLGLAAAVHHPESEVLCIEKNPAAAECAKEVVKLCGMADRVTVETGDALNFPLPDTDLSISETFGQILRTENGPGIMRRLSAYSKSLLPRYARIYAADKEPLWPEDWQTAGLLDFRDFDGMVSGSVYATVPNFCQLYVRIGLLDEDRRPVLDELSASPICEPVFMKRILDSYEVGTPIRFSYEAGQGHNTIVNHKVDK